MTEVLASELNRILSDASLFAGRDDSLPMLNQVKLEATGTDLVAIATDRFMVGVSRVPFISEPWELGLRLEQVNLVLQATKRGRGSSGRGKGFVNLEPTPKRFKLHVDFPSGEVVHVPAYQQGEFPKWRQLITEPVTGASVGSISFNPAYMAKFGKVQGGHRGQQMYMRFTSPSRPCQVHIGEHFVGLIMPVRLPDDGGTTTQVPDWLKAVK